MYSHTNLPGLLSKENSCADVLIDYLLAFNQARQSHDFIHQNSKTLKTMFQTTHMQLQQIMMAFPHVKNFQSANPEGCNP